MAKPYFRSNYAENPTKFDGPFWGAVCVPLTRGLHALVDAQDINGSRWHVSKSGYMAKTRSGTGSKIFFHRVLMCIPSGLVCDHINGNTLDNRRLNLRVCTQSQNMMNVKKSQCFDNQYKGVNFSRGRWNAGIKLAGKRHYLGAFDTQEDAARAFDVAAKIHRGEFARLNFPLTENGHE